MTNLLKFLGKFLILALLVGVLWVSYLGPLYNHVIIFVLDHVIIPDEFQLQRGPHGQIAVVQPQVGGDPILVLSFHLITLHYNVIPLIALFLVTPGMPWKKKLIYLPIALVLLSLTHFLHAYLGFFKVTHKSMQYDFTLLSWFTAMWLRFVIFLQAFWEQAGSRLISFLLWILFFPNVVSSGISKISE